MMTVNSQSTDCKDENHSQEAQPLKLLLQSGLDELERDIDTSKESS